MEDLDSLLADLNDNTTNTKQTSGNQSSKIDLDELDDLMNDLNTENDPQPEPLYQEEYPEPEYHEEVHEEYHQEPQSQGDELDDLLEGLSSMSDSTPQQTYQKPVQQQQTYQKPVQQQTYQKPVQQQQTYQKPAQPTYQKPVQEPVYQEDNTMDELDALVEGLNDKPIQKQSAPMKQNNVQISSSDDTLDELDQLMIGLDGPSTKTTPVTSTRNSVTPPQQNKPSPTQNRPSQFTQPPQQNRPSQQFNNSPQVQNRGSSGAFPQNQRNSQTPPIQNRNTVATFGQNNTPPQQNRPSQQFNNAPVQNRNTVSTFGQNQTQNRPSQQFNNPPPQQNRPSQDNYGGGAVDDLDDLLSGMDDLNVGGNNYTPQPVQNRTSNTTNLNRPSNNFGGSGIGNKPQPQMINYNNVSPVQSGPSRGICGGCNQPIHGQILQALGKMWHPEHFVCGNCKSELGTANFYEQEGKPHCENCYQQLFCPRCASCDQPIMSRVITALGKKWHPEHFVCTTCNASFQGGTFYEREGYPYCQEHYYNSQFAVKCASCGEGIVGDCVNALGTQWHTNCFVCQYCRKAFTSGQFYEMNGLPYCEMHYYSNAGSVCSGCNKSITGKSVSALGKNWHPEHFVCGFCYNPIAGGNYQEKDSKAYCTECFGKLYS